MRNSNDTRRSPQTRPGPARSGRRCIYWEARNGGQAGDIHIYLGDIFLLATDKILSVVMSPAAPGCIVVVRRVCPKL